MDLLSANGGYFFNDSCLRPEYNRHQCEIRTRDDRSPLLPNTRCVLLLGESAAKEWIGESNSLNEIRGSPYLVGGIPHIASYFPQDCVDIVDHESRHNPLSDKYVHDEDEDYHDEDDEDAGNEKRRHGRTKRRNYGFWLRKDTAKCKHILKHGLPEVLEPEYVIYPRAEEVINLLETTHDEYLYFDCETDCELNITCFSFSFNSKTIYVAPCLLPDYSWAYSSLPEIYRALAIAIHNNTLVAHNGSNFDFFVLGHKLKIPIGKSVYDTLIAQHRCYPEVEKSLGHCTSLWTWEKFHKDEGDVPYSNMENARRIWLYCGKDTFTMSLIRPAIDEYARRNPGITESISQANTSIRPYLIASLLGMRYDVDALQMQIAENDELCMQYLRWLDILIGEENLKTIRGSGKSPMPASNPQCCRYFHDMLGYPIVAKGKVRKDGTKGPSLGKKAMFKLRLNHHNPVIDTVIAYRETIKESGALSFTPWKS